jgi:ABC-type multidrug transport system ATPase subunit
MVSFASEGLVLNRLTVAHRKVVVCREVSLRVPARTVYALLGRRGAGKSSLIACVAGQRKPSAGQVLVAGADAWKERRRLRKIVALVTPQRTTPANELLSRAVAREPRLLLLDGFDFGSGAFQQPALDHQIRTAAAGGAAVLLATESAAIAGSIADRVGILRDGALVLDDDVRSLLSRFRRIRYRNEMTPTRTEYGTELDLFEAVRVRVRGWGVEAVVANFSEELFKRLLGTDGVTEVDAAFMTIGEIFDAASPARIERA